MMLQIGAGHSNNCQVKLKLLDMTNFEMICSTKKFQADLEVSEVTNRVNLEA